MNAWPCQLDDLATWHTTLPHGMPGHAIAGESREAVGGLRYRIMEIDWVIRPLDAGEAIYRNILH
ncbi:hypothetical protein DsansV1_C01g0008291 [Dioscorea sansibarensis]